MQAWWVPPTLRGYQRSWLGPDALATITLVAVAVPSQIATARLAGLAPVLGLYAFVAGSLLYALLGPSRHLSVGADSTIAPVLAAAAAATSSVGSRGYGTAVALTAVLVGLALVVLGTARLGWIADFLSIPVTTGVLAGIGVEIAIRQLPALLGVSGGGTTTLGRIETVVRQSGQVNGWAVGIGAGVLLVIVLGHRLSRRVPGALIALVVSIGLVDAFGLAARHGVPVLGTVHGGLPSVRFPALAWSEVRRLAAPVLTVAFLCVAQTAATVRASGDGVRSPEDFNRDLVSVGAGSLAAGLLGAPAVNASPPNTVLLSQAGGRSQLTGAMAAAVVAVVAVAATAPLAHLPQATLAATLVYIATRLFRVGELRTILRFDRLEFALSATALVVVAVVGIEQGLVVAMGLSLAERTWRSARPRDTLLGCEPGTDHWIPVDIGRPSCQVPGVLVYLVYAPLWYGNADFFRFRLRRLIDDAPEPVRVLVLDADGMSDIDYTGLLALRDMADEMGLRNVTVGIARASHLVHHDLKHGALLQHLGSDHLFASVEEAVTALSPPS